MPKKTQQKNKPEIVDLFRQGLFEDEVADLVLKKVFSEPSFKSVLEKYQAGQIDDFDFVDAVWQKFNDQLE